MVNIKVFCVGLSIGGVLLCFGNRSCLMVGIWIVCIKLLIFLLNILSKKGICVGVGYKW